MAKDLDRGIHQEPDGERYLPSSEKFLAMQPMICKQKQSQNTPWACYRRRKQSG